MTEATIKRVAAQLRDGGGKRLRQLRLRYGISTVSLTQKSGLLIASIAGHESGKKLLPAASADRLRVALTQAIVDHCLETAFVLAPKDPRLAKLRAVRIRPATPGARGGLVIMDDETGDITYGP
jgi:hypothetical protein